MTVSHAYERQSLAKRGHFSNYLTLNPVRRLVFDETGVAVSTRTSAETVPYASLTAEILETYMFKGYGGSGSYIKQTLVSLKSPKRTYKFDLSGNFPDFKERREILDLIRTRIMTTESSQSLSKIKRGHNIVGAVLIGCCLVLLLLLWIWRDV